MILRQALVHSVYLENVLIGRKFERGESALLLGLQLHF